MIKKKRTLRFASSWDDGNELDIRLADLLEKYHLPGTFYIPGMVFSDMVKTLSDRGFEIGGHTVLHPQDLKLLSDEELLWEITENKKALEETVSKKVSKFCYPRGRYDKRAITVLQSLGFESARTTKVLELYSPTPFESPTAIHVYQRKEYQGKDWLEMAYEMVRRAEEVDRVFHIWGHSWEIERDGNWEKLDLFFNWITDNYEIINS